MLDGICVVYIAVRVLVGLADKNKVGVVLHQPVKNLLAVFQR